MTKKVKDELMNTNVTDHQTVRLNPDNPIELDNFDQTQKDKVVSRRSVDFEQACEQCRIVLTAVWGLYALRIVLS